MSETLSRILYNNAGEASAASEGTTYDAALRDTQNYLSQNHAGTLAETVLQEQARETVRFLIEQYLTTHKVYAGGLSIQELTTRLYRDMAGYSILEEPLADPGVEEIIVNGYDDIEIVDENGRRKTGLRFGNGGQARDIARRLVRLSGHSIDTAHPMVDAYITTGVRVTALFPPLIPDEAGAAFTIRKQRLGNVTRSQLIRWGTASEEVLDFLEACLDHGVSVSIAGKTGSGKTTLLSYLLNNLDERQRIVTIEETREILIVNPVGDNGVRRKSVLALCTRPSDEERMDIDMRALLRTALRLRPDIITMAEMRGPEALDAQEAARTGHTVASTLHANSATQAYARMMTMCQMGAVNVPAHILMSLIVEAFPIAVFCRQLGNSHRCITEVVEAYGALDGEARTRTLFAYEPTKDGGDWRRVGAISPRVAERMRNNGAEEAAIRRYAEEPPLRAAAPRGRKAKSAAKGQAASDGTEGQGE